MVESAARVTEPGESAEDKRSGLMAAIRTAMREIGEDVTGEAPGTAPGPGAVEIHPDLPRVNPSLVFGATMALWHPPRFTPHELLDTVNEILEGTGAVAAFDPDMKDADEQPRFSLLKRRLKGPPSAILRVNGLRTLVGGGDKPAFAGKALEERVNPALWAEGVKRLSQSRGHVMIADAHPPDPSDADLNYDRAVAVTVTAGAVSLLTESNGIIWHPAGNATPPDVIPDFVQSLAEGIAPLLAALADDPPRAGAQPRRRLARARGAARHGDRDRPERLRAGEDGRRPLSRTPRSAGAWRRATARRWARRPAPGTLRATPRAAPPARRPSCG